MLKDKIRQILRENETVDRILDKIGKFGMKSLTHLESEYLKKHSKGIEDKNAEELLAIDTGSVFERDLANHLHIKFTYDSTEEYGDGEVVHKGDAMLSEKTLHYFKEYSVEIWLDETGEYANFTLHDGNDYVEFENEDELNEFFKEIADKLNATL